MNKDKIINQLLPFKNFFIRYVILIFVICVVAVFSYLTIEISHYANADPTQDQITAKEASFQSVKLNQQAVNKILELQSQNISIQSLFDNSRNNPFN